MSLSDHYNDFSTGRYETLEVDSAAILPPKNQVLEMPIRHCANGFFINGHNADLNPVQPMPYDYSFKIEFAPGKRDEFLARPDVKDSYYHIENIVTFNMHETLALETVRDDGVIADAGRELSDREVDTLVRTINEATYGDVEIVNGDILAILQETFPDAGILDARVDSLRGQNSSCSFDNGEEIQFAQRVEPAAAKTLAFSKAGF